MEVDITVTKKSLSAPEGILIQLRKGYPGSKYIYTCIQTYRHL